MCVCVLPELHPHLHFSLHVSAASSSCWASTLRRCIEACTRTPTTHAHKRGASTCRNVICVHVHISMSICTCRSLARAGRAVQQQMRQPVVRDKPVHCSTKVCMCVPRFARARYCAHVRAQGAAAAGPRRKLPRGPPRAAFGGSAGAPDLAGTGAAAPRTGAGGCGFLRAVGQGGAGKRRREAALRRRCGGAAAGGRALTRRHDVRVRNHVAERLRAVLFDPRRRKRCHRRRLSSLGRRRPVLLHNLHLVCHYARHMARNRTGWLFPPYHW